jgi:hypothetical protein
MRVKSALVFCLAVVASLSYALAEDDVSFNPNIASPNCAQACDGACWHWNAGVEGTFLDPKFHSTGNPNADTALALVDPGWTAAPRIWLGIENNSGWGARVRYWELGTDNSLLDDPNVMPGGTANIFQNLQMYDIDAELTKRFDIGAWNLLGSFGGRFGSLDRFDMANLFSTAGPPNALSFEFNNRVDAGGITAALEISRPIGSWGLELFGSFRASELWGNSDAYFAIHQTGGTPTNASFSDRFDADLTIWETQVGLQCAKQLASCQGEVFARCAFEYQAWVWTVPGGNPGPGNIFNPGVDLYGVSFAIGFQH